jgi:hypothetical protein
VSCFARVPGLPFAGLLNVTTKPLTNLVEAQNKFPAKIHILSQIHQKLTDKKAN